MWQLLNGSRQSKIARQVNILDIKLTVIKYLLLVGIQTIAALTNECILTQNAFISKLQGSLLVP